jgi:hypothetical protein
MVLSDDEMDAAGCRGRLNVLHFLTCIAVLHVPICPVRIGNAPGG